MAQIAPGLQAGPPLATLSGPAPLSPSHRLQMGLEGATVSDSKPFLTGLGSGTEPRSGSALQPAGSPKHVPESEDPPEAPGTAERNGGPISESLSEPSPLTQDGRASVGCVGQSSSLPLPKSSLYSDLCPAMGLSTAKSIPGSSSGANPIPSSTPGPLADSILMPPPDSSVGSVSGTNSAPNSMLCRGIGSLSSLGPGIPYPRSTKPQALDTLSYLDSVSMMSGTMESLTGTGLGDDASSMGSDSEINGMGFRKTDRYGFLGGNQTAGGERSIPVEVARQRELKWLDMFKHWDKWILHRFQKVKLRCRKGIPSSLRAKAWQYLSNSIEHLEKNPGKFEELERQPGDPKWLDIIEKDLHRQFPFHEMFAARGGHGQQDLYRILKAYTIYKPDEGYCQAQAPVAAVLLMHMPAEQAFWCLVQICEKYLPGYYSAGLEAIQLDGEIFFALLRRVSSMAYRHLKRYKIDPILYMTEWFMCIFSRTLPWSSVLRIWDMFFCEGVKIVFRVGLVLLRSTLGVRDKLRDCQGMYETMEKLRNIPMQYMQEDLLAYEVINLQVTEALIERENAIQRKKWEESRGALQHKPSRRLYGSRAIYEEKYRMNPPLSASASLLSLTSLKKFKEDKKDRQWMFRDQASFSPMHSVSNLAAPPDNHPLPPSPTLSLTFNSTARPAKEEKKKEIESGKQKQKGKDKAEKESKKPLLSMDKPSHEAPELTSQVVSEGLRPSLPSPTANITPLGEPKKNKEEKKKEKELEKQRAKEQKEKEKEMLKQLKLEKEKEKKLMKEKGKEEAKFKKEKKSSKQKDQPETTEISKDNKSQKGETKENGASSAKVVSEKGDLQGPIEAATTSALAQTPADNQNASGSSSNRNSAGMLQDTYF